MPDIRAPDGSIRRFPDSMSQDQIAVIMRREFPAPRPSGSEFVGGRSNTRVERPSTAGGAALSLAQGVGDFLTSTVQGLPGNAGMLAGQNVRAGAGNNAAARQVADTLDPLGRPGAVPRYEPQGMVERNAARFGRFLPNAAYPASLPARAAQVLLPAAGEAVGERFGGQPGAIVGGLLGGVLSSVRPGARFRPSLPTPTPAETAARVIRRGGREASNPVRLRAQQAELQAAGVGDDAITAADLTTPRGRQVIRAAATRSDGGRVAAEEFREGRALDLPGRMSRQARRTVSSEPRTPGQVQASIVERRNRVADRQFGRVRNQEIGLEPVQVTALRSDYGNAAMREAARRERDPETRAALLRLADDALDNPGGVRVTVGMMDRISRVLLSQADDAGADRDLAGLLRGLGNDIRRPTSAAVPGYQVALDNYAAESRLNEASQLGETFLERNTDEFVEGLRGRSREEMALAQASARRAIERASGESIGGAPGRASAIANAPEQQARNAALLGPEGAQQLQSGMRAEGRLVRNAAAVDPGTNSTTAPSLDASQALEGPGEIVRLGTQAATGGIAGKVGAAIGAGRMAARSFGLSEQDAETFVRAALDPRRTDEIIRAIEARNGRPGSGRQFLQYVAQQVTNPRLLGTAVGIAAGQAQLQQ